MFEDVESFCLFMGYTRSGHSLVGALLDAHPEAVIPHEGKIFERNEDRASDQYGYTGHLRFADRDALFNYLVRRSTRQAAGGRRGTRLVNGVPTRASYGVPDAHQGEYTKLRVIGNKSGQESPIVWDRNPAIFEELEAMAGVPVRFLHVFRNPWDNIASMSRTHGTRAINRYFRRATIIARFKEEGRWPMLDVCLEDLIADPESEIRRLMGFYDLPVDDAFVSACRSLIDDQPNPSRKTREWPRADIKNIRRRKQAVPWLSRYPDVPR